MSNTQKTQAITTPSGSLQWVYVTGQGKLDYSGNNYNYTASIIINKAEAKPVLETIGAFYKECGFTAAPKSLGYKPLDAEGNSRKVNEPALTDAETASYLFTFNTRTKFKDDSPKKVVIKNAVNQAVAIGDTKIGNGTYGAIFGKMRCYQQGPNTGVSLFLDSVQIKRLVEYVGADNFTVDESEGAFIEPEFTKTSITPSTEPDLTKTSVIPPSTEPPKPIVTTPNTAQPKPTVSGPVTEQPKQNTTPPNGASTAADLRL